MTIHDSLFFLSKSLKLNSNVVSKKSLEFFNGTIFLWLNGWSNWNTVLIGGFSPNFLHQNKCKFCSVVGVVLKNHEWPWLWNIFLVLETHFTTIFANIGQISLTERFHIIFGAKIQTLLVIFICCQDVKKYVKTFLEPEPNTWKISYFGDAKKILPRIRLLCLKLLNGRRGFDTSRLEAQARVTCRWWNVRLSSRMPVDNGPAGSRKIWRSILKYGAIGQQHPRSCCTSRETFLRVENVSWFLCGAVEAGAIGWLGLSPLVTLYTSCPKTFRIRLVGNFVLFVDD